MSSTYRILCLSHDPAITDEAEYSTSEAAAQRIAAGVGGHVSCDLAIGRYSYPLVEAGCPASRDQPAQLRCGHGSTIWVDAHWLRLLAAAHQSTDPAVLAAVTKGGHRCWPPERIQRLRLELDLPTA